MITISPSVYKYLVDPFERAGSTFAQQLSVILLATGGGSLLVRQHWLAAADAGGFAAIAALLTSYGAILLGLSFADPVVDFVRRVVLTFVQSFVGALVATTLDPSVLHADWKGALAVGVLAAMTAALKAAGGLTSDHTVGASIIPLHQETREAVLAAAA